MDVRSMRGSDVDVISRMVLKTQEMDMYGDEIAFPVSRYYVMSYQTGSRFSFVAEADGETLGCVIGGVGWDRSRYRENVAVTERCDTTLSVMLGYDAYISDIDIMEKTDMEFVDSTGEAYDSQLILLIVSESMPRRGIRSALYGKVMEEFSANGCRRVLIFTDDDCGYSFYDMDDCRKAGETTVSLRFEELRMMFYIKDLNIDRRLVAVRHP